MRKYTLPYEESAELSLGNVRRVYQCRRIGEHTLAFCNFFLGNHPRRQRIDAGTLVGLDLADRMVRSEESVSLVNAKSVDP